MWTDAIAIIATLIADSDTHVALVGIQIVIKFQSWLSDFKKELNNLYIFFYLKI